MENSPIHVSYNGRNFRVPQGFIKELSEDSRIQDLTFKTAERGKVYDLGSCFLCGYHRNNVVSFVLRMNGPVSMTFSEGEGERRGIFVEGCSYHQNNLRYSSIYSDSCNDGLIEAWKTPCVEEDSFFEVLVNGGHLDSHETFEKVKLPFAYSIFTRGDYTPRRGTRKQRSFFNRAGLILKDKFRS